MYDLMTQLTNMGMPIVFKGALVLKAIQHTYGNPQELERETKDIDGDWSGQPVSMGQLTNLMQRAVITAGYSEVIVKAVRSYGEGKQAGFRFLHNNRAIASMDLSMCINHFGVAYQIGKFNFYGQQIEKIIADKLFVVSGSKVFRRIKDVIDLYILQYIWRGTYIELQNTIRQNKSIDKFSEFINDTEKLEHAYSKYKNKASRYDFNTVYNRVRDFIGPFIRNDSNMNLYWNGDSWVC